MMTKQDLINFECQIADMFNAGKLPRVVHLSGGNEDQLIEIFKEIKPEDWVFSTWRSHYHALLKGMEPESLKAKIIAGQSMHVMDKSLNFFSSAIVGGCCPIAVGVAMGLQKKFLSHLSDVLPHVWCFIGDGATDQGVFWESARYVDAHELPCTFILEDNSLAVDTPSSIRYGEYNRCLNTLKCLRYYAYERKYPHCQTGVWVKEYADARYM